MTSLLQKPTTIACGWPNRGATASNARRDGRVHHTMLAMYTNALFNNINRTSTHLIAKENLRRTPRVCIQTQDIGGLQKVEA